MRPKGRTGYLVAQRTTHIFERHLAAQFFEGLVKMFFASRSIGAIDGWKDARVPLNGICRLYFEAQFVHYINSNCNYVQDLTLLVH